MATASPETLPTSFVETTTSDTISVTGEGTVAVVSVSASPFLPQGITVSLGGSSVTISGKYPIGLFDSLAIKTIEKTKSDKTSEVLTYTSFDDIPTQRQVFSYASPTTPRVTVTYSLQVSETDAGTMEETISTVNVTKDIEFSYDEGKNALRNYI
jgi:hypothetical protein